MPPDSSDERRMTAEKRRRSLRELAQEALDVQDACNLSGVVHSFARALSDLWEHCDGTDQINKHPISIVWADKIAHLTGTQGFGYDNITAAYRKVHELAEGAIPAAHVENES